MVSDYRCQHCGCTCGACELPDSTCFVREMTRERDEARAALREVVERVSRVVYPRATRHPAADSSQILAVLESGADSRQERIDAVLAWARWRIRECRKREAKFAGAWDIGARHGPPQALVESWAERRALEAVVRMLGGEGDVG